MHDSTNSTAASNRGWPSTGQCWQAPNDLRRRAHGESGQKGWRNHKRDRYPAIQSICFKLNNKHTGLCKRKRGDAYEGRISRISPKEQTSERDVLHFITNKSRILADKEKNYETQKIRMSPWRRNTVMRPLRVAIHTDRMWFGHSWRSISDG